MKVKMLTFLCLMALFSVSSPIVSAQVQYKIHFNNIVCVNPWNVQMREDFLDLAVPLYWAYSYGSHGEPVPPERQRYTYPSSRKYSGGGDFAMDGRSTTNYFKNMSFDKFPNDMLNPARYKEIAGSPNASINDRFYMTYKNKPREGMVLPVRGG